MMFMFAMIAFVTNLAAPIGTIWGYQFQGNSFLGMLGNMMNFLAYLFMGIPAGKLLSKIGYKKTALWALAIGAIGMGVQYASSMWGGEIHVASSSVIVTENIHGGEYQVEHTFHIALNFIIYLLGAFIAGFCVCMLNTVVNPMLNLLGGGGNKGMQLLQTGGTLNSLAATLTPFLVGVLIGALTPRSQLSDVDSLLWIAIGIFIAAFIIISFVNIPEPQSTSTQKTTKMAHSPWHFRHTVLGVIGIFIYVGIEVGVPGTLMFYLSDQKSSGAGILGDASTIAGAIVAIYWLLMLVGRFASSFISGKVSTRNQLLAVSGVGVILVILAICSSKETQIGVPTLIYDPVETTTSTLKQAGMPDNEIQNFISNPTEDALKPYTTTNTIQTTQGPVAKTVVNESTKEPMELISALVNAPGVPIAALFLVLVGLCTSVMWGGIFNLAVEGLGKYTAQASGIFMMMVVGGGVIPLVQQLIADAVGYMTSYWLMVGCLGYLFIYGLWGCINVNKDIPVDDDDDNEKKALKEQILNAE
ncbi:MAG: MFS transporter [Muribaculaceae bacterium]|nr:MFS transporter [Muribaculaceae bacterium]